MISTAVSESASPNQKKKSSPSHESSSSPQYIQHLLIFQNMKTNNKMCRMSEFLSPSPSPSQSEKNWTRVRVRVKWTRVRTRVRVPTRVTQHWILVGYLVRWWSDRLFIRAFINYLSVSHKVCDELVVCYRC